MAVVAAVLWPGLPMYDTVSQYDQVLSGEVTDWHPPIMVRLWQLLHPLGPGTLPMFLLQTALYALGWCLIVAALVRIGRNKSAVGAGVLALSPLLIGWQMVVIKDAQMQGALIAGFGIVAYFRLRRRKVPLAALGAVALLLLYATLVRANAVFVTAPLVLLLAPRPAAVAWKAVAGVAVIALVLIVSPPINHRLLGAEDSGVAKSQAMFDLAAIAVGNPNPWPFTRAERDAIARRHCVKSYFWDPLGDPTACGPIVDRLNQEDEKTLYLDLAKAVAAHPLAYAEHRIRHWNSSERWLVPPNLQEAAPPDEAEPNDLGLKPPRSSLAPRWQLAAAAEAATPLGWPILWTVLALSLLPAAWRRREEPAGGLALALIASALTLEASFLVISIASDLRYHLWPMSASALALILLSDGLALRRWEWLSAAALLGLIVAAGSVTRATLPAAPDTYEGMIHAASG